MEIYRDYGRFKSACGGFEALFTENRLQTGSLFCHPLIDGLIYVPCSPEETKTHGLNICRMSDMMLMSEDGENFIPFNITRAREIAAENERVFLCDLNGSGAFEARSWMIDGKHDTLIISEEHMKKEGKPYAPVTPLTNVFLNFKKITCNFLYKEGTIEDPAVLSQKDVEEMLDKYAAALMEEFPGLEAVGETDFPLYGGMITTDKNESRCMELDKGLCILDTIETSLKVNDDAFKAADIKTSSADICRKAAVMAAGKCGVEVTVSDLAGAKDTAALKDTLRRLISEKNTYGFKYTAADREKAEGALRAIELSSATAEEIKKDICGLLSVRPVFPAVYNLARAASPADAEDIENISAYWQSKALDAKALGEYLDKAYIPADCRDEKGKLCCEGTKAAILLDDITNASAKYKLKNAPVAAELSAYCDEFERESRTYNGTVFDTVADMEKAVKNEKELADLCADLSALSEEELKKLRDYIYNMKLDRKTTGKYLLKIKLALNDCQLNQLKLMTTGLGMRSAEELKKLKERLSGDEFDEVVAAPFIGKVNDGILKASLNELKTLFASIPDEAKAAELEKKLESGEYDKMLKKHFSAKIADARDGFARSRLAELVKGIDTADRKGIADISAKLGEVNCREALKAPYKKLIAAKAEAAENAEAAKIFGTISSADREKVAELKNTLKAGGFSAAVVKKYDAQLDDRLTEINNQEFVNKCETIFALDRNALGEIVKELNSGKYPDSIKEKYLPKAAERENVLKKNDLAAMCKDIATMDNAALDTLEKKIRDMGYPDEITADCFDKIADRRKAIKREEADALCKDIGTMQKPQLLELAEKLKAGDYPQDCVNGHLADIDKQIDRLEKEKLSEMCKDLGGRKKQELEQLTNDINALDFKKENTAPWLEKIRQSEIDLMKKEMENLCKNIDNTPRKELSKLKEALLDGDFDKELSAKYIEQIDRRTESLIKKELEELCRNLANAPKDKLMEIKLTISDTPEYKEAGKAYSEQIEVRLKQLDKAEFDKQMSDIDNLDREKLEKFMDDLDKRKPTLDPKRYEETLKKCNEREEHLEKQELDKICAGVVSADLKELTEIKEKIAEGDYIPAVARSYFKMVDDAITNAHVKYFTKLTENINSMSRAELVVLLEKVEKNETNCPADMLQRYVAQVNKKIRDADCNFLAAKCRNLGSFSERRSLELIKDINAMDMDDSDRKRFISQIELHINHLKTTERDAYLEKLENSMAMNNITGAHFYLPGKPAFDNVFIAVTKTFALEQFDMPLLIHEKTPGKADDSFMMTMNFFWSQGGTGGLVHLPIEKVDKFDVKKSVFSSVLRVVEKDGRATDLPCGIDKKLHENAAKVMNSILMVIQSAKAEAAMKAAEELKAAEEAKQQELEEQRREIEIARKKAIEAENAKNSPAENTPVKPAAAPVTPVSGKPAAAASEDKKAAVKPIKPIEVVISPIPEVKHIAPLDSLKPGETSAAKTGVTPASAGVTPATIPAAAKTGVTPASAGVTPATIPAAAKTGVTPASAGVTPASAIKPAEPVKAASSAVPIKPVTPTAAPAIKPLPPVAPVISTAPAAPAADAAAKTAEPAKPVMRIKFCDQCGAKITNENAKFCMECGNKLIH